MSARPRGNARPVARDRLPFDPPRRRGAAPDDAMVDVWVMHEHRALMDAHGAWVRGMADWSAVRRRGRVAARVLADLDVPVHPRAAAAFS